MDDARIQLFLERAAVLRSSRAVATIDETAMTMRFSGDGPDVEVELTAPDDEATLAYFARIREFDSLKNLSTYPTSCRSWPMMRHPNA